MFKVRPKILIFTIALFGLLSFYVLKFTHKDHMPSSVVTEYILTPFGYPHPYLLSFVAQYRFVHQVGEFLVRRDNHQNIVGGLASSWKISEDRRKITFNLRPDLYNAHEVAQSLNRLIRAGQTSHSNLAAQTDPSKVRVLNDLTLEIETIGDAGAILSPLVMADAVILPDDHWIQVEGFKDPQVDWTKTKGPYIYVSGKFPAGVNEPILFKPNPKHYFYDAKSVDWRLIYRPLDSISSLTELDNLLKSSPAFTTVRYTEQNKLFFTPDPGLAFYETRPNGICFLMPNLKSAVLKSRDARLAILKNIRSAVFPTLRKDSRADQIPQPGLSGRLSSEDFAKLVERTEKSAAHKFERPVVWLQSTAAGANPDLVASVAKAAGVPFTLKPGPDNPLSEEWKKGDYDIQIVSVGMSDTDPISGATFFFSPTAINLDLPDHTILKVLNSAKDTSDREKIVGVVREAFKIAYENALVIPLFYTVNRHYYSRGLALNISDPFSESIRIWEVRLDQAN